MQEDTRNVCAVVNIMPPPRALRVLARGLRTHLYGSIETNQLPSGEATQAPPSSTASSIRRVDTQAAQRALTISSHLRLKTRTESSTVPSRRSAMTTLNRSRSRGCSRLTILEVVVVDPEKTLARDRHRDRLGIRADGRRWHRLVFSAEVRSRCGCESCDGRRGSVFERRICPSAIRLRHRPEDSRHASPSSARHREISGRLPLRSGSLPSTCGADDSEQAPPLTAPRGV